MDRREGRWIYYTINADALAEVAELAQTLATALPPRADGCC
jgi:hypothetical protein